MHCLFGMFFKKEVLFCLCSSTLIYSMPRYPWAIRIEWNVTASDQYWTCYSTKQKQESKNKKHRSSIKCLVLKWTQKNLFVLFSLSDCRTRL